MRPFWSWVAALTTSGAAMMRCLMDRPRLKLAEFLFLVLVELMLALGMAYVRYQRYPGHFQLALTPAIVLVKEMVT